MDPNANLTEQIALARSIVERIEQITDDGGNTPDEFWHDGTVDDLLTDAERLSALVMDLNEWRVSGGFDPLKSADSQRTC